MTQRQRDSINKAQFDELVKRNLDAIKRIDIAVDARRNQSDVVSDTIAGFCGSPLFIYVHCFIFGGWLIWNSSSLASKSMRFDPPPFNILILVVAIEAIFLSTIILISQSRQRRDVEQRSHLELQINLLAEQESSELLIMVKQIMDHLGIAGDNAQAGALQQTTDPEQLAEQIQENIDAESEPEL